MHVQVWDGFAAVRAVVDDDAEAFGESQGSCEFTGGEEQVAEQIGVSFLRLAHAGNYSLGDDEQVHGCLRVVNGDAVIVLVRDFCRNFAGDDFFK